MGMPPFHSIEQSKSTTYQFAEAIAAQRYVELLEDGWEARVDHSGLPELTRDTLKRIISKHRDGMEVILVQAKQIHVIWVRKNPETPTSVANIICGLPA